MGATATPHRGPAPPREELESSLRAMGLAPRWWGNPPGDTYAPHAHAYHKVLFCARGSITFHTPDGDLHLRPGDRLDIDPDTEHAATVGPDGVSCVEAPRDP